MSSRCQLLALVARIGEAVGDADDGVNAELPSFGEDPRDVARRDEGEHESGSLARFAERRHSRSAEHLGVGRTDQ